MNKTLPSIGKNYQGSHISRPRILVLALRETDSQPETHLLIEREESIERDENGVLTKAMVRLHYHEIGLDGDHLYQAGGDFCGCYERDCSSTEEYGSITSCRPFSDGAVYVDPVNLRGRFLGTYLMDMIIEWVKAWPEANIKPIQLLSNQASSENTARRNRFYEQFNIKFEYSDPNKEAGVSLPMKACDLSRSCSWEEHIQEYPLDQYLCQQRALIDRCQMSLGMYQSEVNSLNSTIESYRRHPIWWGLKITWIRHSSSALTVAVIILVGLTGWMRYS